jgi:Fe2+ or Zn2+ uptake regulation protein
MSRRNAELDQAFRRVALRPTAQRYAVLEFLAARATVYNSLHSLAKAGLVHEILFEGKAARFDAKLHRHHHFICDECGAGAAR